VPDQTQPASAAPPKPRRPRAARSVTAELAQQFNVLPGRITHHGVAALLACKDDAARRILLGVTRKGNTESATAKPDGARSASRKEH